MTAEADLRRADAMRDAKIISEENWEHAKYRVDETISEVTRFRGDGTASEADLNAANVQLEQSRIVAPFAGVVGRSTVRPAQEVKPGDVLFLDHRRSAIAGAVHRTRNLNWGRSQPVSRWNLQPLTFQGFTRRDASSGSVRWWAPASGSIQVVGAVIHPSRLLKPGMTMQVRLAP